MAELRLDPPSRLPCETAGLRLSLASMEGILHLLLREAEAPPASFPPMGRLVEMSGAECAAIAPGEWLILGATSRLLAEMEKVLADRLHLLVDRSHQLVMLRLEGEGAASALAAFCPLDLRTGHFGEGDVATSLIGDIVATVVARPAGYDLVVEQVALPYVWQLFEDHVFGAASRLHGVTQ
jgi:heterotetrameric sarcosine oxidase gamma subunit